MEEVMEEVNNEEGEVRARSLATLRKRKQLEKEKIESKMKRVETQ